MLTPYDRKQQAAEIKQFEAQLDAAKLSRSHPGAITPSCDWDAELAKLAPPEPRP